jgi:hypothetical protein
MSSPGRIEVAFFGCAQARSAKERSAIGLWESKRSRHTLGDRALFTRVDVVA